MYISDQWGYVHITAVTTITIVAYKTTEVAGFHVMEALPLSHAAIHVEMFTTQHIELAQTI